MFGLPLRAFAVALSLGFVSLFSGRLLEWSWRDSLFVMLWTFGVILLAWRTVLYPPPPK